MIPFLTEVLELVAAGLLLAGALPFLKSSKYFSTVSGFVFYRNLTTQSVHALSVCKDIK